MQTSLCFCFSTPVQRSQVQNGAQPSLSENLNCPLQTHCHSKCWGAAGGKLGGSAAVLTAQQACVCVGGSPQPTQGHVASWGPSESRGWAHWWGSSRTRRRLSPVGPLQPSSLPTLSPVPWGLQGPCPLGPPSDLCSRQKPPPVQPLPGPRTAQESSRTGPSRALLPHCHLHSADTH